MPWTGWDECRARHQAGSRRWVGSGEGRRGQPTEETFDVAVVDIGLPGMDGLALTAQLRRTCRTWPVLILTARDALQDRVQGLDGAATTT